MINYQGFITLITFSRFLCIQVAISVAPNFGTLAIGASTSMSGILLAQVKESDEKIKLSDEQGSWFGNILINKHF